MHTLTFLEDLAVVMIVAGLVTVACHRLRQPVVLGYMIAGIIIGPHTPPFPLITDREAIDTLAQLGIIFLMFSLGLEFNLRKLRRVGTAAFVAALLEIVLMFGAGYAIGAFFGWSRIDSLFLGAMISISSTMIIVKALEELDATREPSSQLIFGILIVEDILAIAMIALLSGVAATGAVDPVRVLLTVGRLVVFVGALLVVGLLTLPRFLDYVGRFRRDEVLLITVLAACFGTSLLSARLGYSVALGAFAAGAIIAESRETARVHTLTGPIRDMFSAVFFVAVGLMIDPRMIVEHAAPIAVITVVVVVGKIVTCAAGAFFCGYDTRTSLRVGMGLAQIGEFSFIIAALGGSLRVTSDFLYPTAVCVSAVTTFLTPYLIRVSDPVARALHRGAPRPVQRVLEVYGRRVRSLGEARVRPAGSRLARRLGIRVLIHLLLVSGVFLGARLVLARDLGDRGLLPSSLGGSPAVIWAAAVLVSLPLLVIAIRTLKTLGSLIGGMSTVATGNGGDARTVVATTVVAAGSAGIAVLVVALSAMILPSWQVFAALAVALAGVALLLWRPLARLYGAAESALQHTLQDKPDSAGAAIPLPGALEEGRVESIALPEDAPAAGRRIRDLKLRTRTGASILAIERQDRRIVNPPPEEELQAGDRLFVLGEEAQCRAARALLLEDGPAALRTEATGSSGRRPSSGTPTSEP